MRIKAVTGVLLLMLAVLSCGAKVPTAQDLTGMWSSTSSAAQAAGMSASFCFANDGAVEWVSQAQGRTKRVRGTFRLAGDVLTIESPDLDAPATLRASLSMGKLELTTPSGSTQKYTKVAGSCDDNGR